jgi:hypothetical protein
MLFARLSVLELKPATLASSTTSTSPLTPSEVPFLS